jgi:hypothetical protein
VRTVVCADSPTTLKGSHVLRKDRVLAVSALAASSFIATGAAAVGEIVANVRDRRSTKFVFGSARQGYRRS